MSSYNMFLMDTLTNMHVGSGDTHFGVVDNLIQRNPVTKVPVIHSSGIKGSLREYFEIENTFDLKTEIPLLFGGEIDLQKDAKTGKMDFTPGHLIFFEAGLLTLPLRSNYNVFYNCTSLPVIFDFLDQIKTFSLAKGDFDLLEKWFKSLNVGANDFLYFSGNNELEIEDYSGRHKYPEEIPENIAKLFKSYFKIELTDLAIFNASIFACICEKSIPVVARNKIDDDGISENLFYEEVLPRRTKLYFIFGADQVIKGKPLANKFFAEFEKGNNIYQFGANYSIGYGFTKISKIA
jgi:CRISPR-associated protein Cmr4